MDNTDKLHALLTVLVSKAILSQSREFKLLMRNVLDRGIDIADAVTILARLQREKALDTFHIIEAENTQSPFFIRPLVTQRFELDRIDENKLNENHVLDIKIFPPFLRELEKAGFDQDEIGTIEPLIAIPDHPEKLEIFCPLDRSTLTKIVTDEDWKEATKGVTYKCKDRNHHVQVMYRNGAVTTSFKLESAKVNSAKLDDENREAVS